MWAHRRWPGGCWRHPLTGETVAATMNKRGYVVWVDLAGERQHVTIRRRQ